MASVISGCAIMPMQPQSTFNTEPVAERNLLAEAVTDVEAAPWPKPRSVSFIARITGGGGEDRVSRSDAVEAYLQNIQHAVDPVQQFTTDVADNLAAAARLEEAAINALAASRRSMNDVALIESAIQSLRENGQIFVIAAKRLRETGAPVSNDAIDTLRDEYQSAVKRLGETADFLAEQIERDHSRTFAAPKNFADL